ncbi:MAG: peptidase M15D vanX D-ala-D-ala dipeptidase [Deltaproteobacteria bacterium]|nr:MAG: peptidase M15D vanX D-ala-D-ala dipeptidase [Deltaproteobacteria bacterium]
MAGLGLLYLCGLGLAVAAAQPLVDAQAADPRLRLDMVYATAQNFVGERLYAEARCFLRPQVVAQLRRAQDRLVAQAPGLHLLLKDCYRPLSVQRRMWQAVRGTARAPYVANPQHPHGSVHTYGAAVDVTLCDARGQELDMGTSHDYLGPLAEPQLEDHYLRTGQLGRKQLRHRQQLRAAMLDGGNFRPIRREWWHFDALQGDTLRRSYARLDVSLTQLTSMSPPARTPSQP